MIKKTKTISSILLGVSLVVTGYNTVANAQVEHGKQKQERVYKAPKKVKNKLTKGQEMAKILSSTNWQGTRVYDKNH
ncbi:DUF4822 domain-containing protein, partial [Gottfriedia acidiceleris]